MKTSVGALLVVTVLAGCSGITPLAEQPAYQPSLVVIAINEPTLDPEGEAASFVLDEDTLYISTEWPATPGSPVSYRCGIYDGKGTLAFVMGGRLWSEVPFTYQSNYSASASTDAPGDWRVVLYTNGRVVFQRNLTGLHPAAPGSKVRKRDA